MKRKKSLIIVLCLVIAAALCILVYAASGYGSEEDPLITKSYLDEVLLPQLETEFQAELETALAGVETQVESGDFAVLTLSKGQTLSCKVGCEILLRLGTAKARGPQYPALVNTTTGDSVYNGSSLVANHLYMVTIEGNGIKADSDITLLIRGDYTIN